MDCSDGASVQDSVYQNSACLDSAQQNGVHQNGAHQERSQHTTVYMNTGHAPREPVDRSVVAEILKYGTLARSLGGKKKPLKRRMVCCLRLMHAKLIITRCTYEPF